MRNIMFYFLNKYFIKIEQSQPGAVAASHTGYWGRPHHHHHPSSPPPNTITIHHHHPPHHLTPFIEQGLVMIYKLRRRHQR